MNDKPQIPKQLTNFIDSCKRAVGSLKKQGTADVYFTAVMYRNGRRLQNGIDKSGTKTINSQLRDYYINERYDRIKLELRKNSDHSVAWTKTTDIPDGEMQSGLMGDFGTTANNGGSFSGLGEAEIGEIIQRKVQEIEQVRQFDQAKTDLQLMTEKAMQLEAENVELKKNIESKKTTERYMHLIGLALPFLAKGLGKSTLGSAYDLLTGSSEEGKQLPETDQRTSVVDMIKEFCEKLSDKELSDLYLLCAEMETDKRLIAHLLKAVTSPPEQTASLAA